MFKSPDRLVQFSLQEVGSAQIIESPVAVAVPSYCQFKLLDGCRDVSAVQIFPDCNGVLKEWDLLYGLVGNLLSQIKVSRLDKGEVEESLGQIGMDIQGLAAFSDRIFDLALLQIILPRLQ